MPALLPTVVVIIAAVAVVVVVAAVVPLVRVLRLPADRPARWARSSTRALPHAGRRVAFVGASIMHGHVSAPLPPRVRAALAAEGTEVDVVNAGVNGDLAYNALQRVEQIRACAPSDAIVLVGTNDVLASLSERDARRYVSGKRLPQRPDRDFYRRSLDALVAALAAAPMRVALCTLPPLGEHLGSVENERVRSYNDVVREVAAVRGVAVLDVHAALVAELGVDAPPGRSPLLGGALLAPMWLHGIGLPLHVVGRMFGFRLLSDGVHLTERAADLVAPLMAGFLRDSSLPR